MTFVSRFINWASYTLKKEKNARKTHFKYVNRYSQADISIRHWHILHSFHIRIQAFCWQNRE